MCTLVSRLVMSQHCLLAAVEGLPQGVWQGWRAQLKVCTRARAEGEDGRGQGCRPGSQPESVLAPVSEVGKERCHGAVRRNFVCTWPSSPRWGRHRETPERSASAWFGRPAADDRGISAALLTCRQMRRMWVLSAGHWKLPAWVSSGWAAAWVEVGVSKGFCS